MKKGERARLYKELKNKMKLASKLKPKTWDDPSFSPYLMVEMREGQSVLSNTIYTLTPKELSLQGADPQHVHALESAMIQCTNKSGVISAKFTKGTVEILSLGRLYDFTFQLEFVGGRKRSIQQMWWCGHCEHSNSKVEVADQYQINSLPLHDDRQQHKYHRLALAASYKEGLGSFVEVVNLQFHEDEEEQGFFYFHPYTLIFKAQKKKSENGQVISPYYKLSVLQVKWDFFIDRERANLYRFRTSVTMEIMNKVSNSCPGRQLLMAKSKCPLSDVDLISPRLEFAAMLSIAIYNFEKGCSLNFDRVLSGAELQRSGKAYSLVIQAEDRNGVYHIKTELHKRPSHLVISLFDMVQQGGAESAAVEM